MRCLSVLIISLLVTACNDNGASDALIMQTPVEMSYCRLPVATSNNVALGIPKNEGLAPSTGQVNVTVLFVDFDDVPATISTDSVFAILNPVAPNFFKEVSYGRMQLIFQPHLKWLRLSKSSLHYGSGIREFQPHLDFIQEAVDLADDEVDFSQTNIVLVMANPDAPALPVGPAMNSMDIEYSIQADSVRITTGITSGYDLTKWGGLWLAHEMGHSLSLPDLYSYTSGAPFPYTGTFSLMGNIAGKAPTYFAFERWMLGWLDDDQIYCHSSGGEVIVDLTALEKPGGTKAIMIPLDNNSALVVESRRKIGFDQNLEKEGALVYIANTLLESGYGPIQVQQGGDKDNLNFDDAPMVKGDTYTYQNVTVEVLQSEADWDRVKIKVKEND